MVAELIGDATQCRVWIPKYYRVPAGTTELFCAQLNTVSYRKGSPFGADVSLRVMFLLIEYVFDGCRNLCNPYRNCATATCLRLDLFKYY